MQNSGGGKNIDATAEDLLKNLAKLLNKAKATASTAVQESGDRAACVAHAIVPPDSDSGKKHQQESKLLRHQQQQQQQFQRQQFQQNPQQQQEQQHQRQQQQQQQQQRQQQQQQQPQQQQQQQRQQQQQQPQQQQQQPQQLATNVGNYSDSARFGTPKVCLQPSELLLRLKLSSWLSDDGTLIVQPSIVDVIEEGLDHNGASDTVGSGDRPAPISKSSCYHEISADEDVRPEQLVRGSGKNKLQLQLHLPQPQPQLPQPQLSSDRRNSAQFLRNLNNSTKEAPIELGGRSGGRRFCGDAGVSGSSGSANLALGKLPGMSTVKRRVDAPTAPTASAADTYAGYQLSADREESQGGDGLALATAAGDRQQLGQLARRGGCDTEFDVEGNWSAETHSGRKQLQLQMQQQQQATLQQPGRRPRKLVSGVQEIGSCNGAVNLSLGRATGRQPPSGIDVGVSSSGKLSTSAGKRRVADCIAQAAYHQLPADGYQVNNHHDSVSDHISEYSDDENTSISDLDSGQQQAGDSGGGGHQVADHGVSVPGHQYPTDTTFALMQRLQEMINNDQATEVDD